MLLYRLFVFAVWIAVILVYNKAVDVSPSVMVVGLISILPLALADVVKAVQGDSWARVIWEAALVAIAFCWLIHFAARM